MLSSQTQEWFIEEIPSGELDREPSEASCGGSPVGAENRPLDTQQSKGETTEGNTSRESDHTTGQGPAAGTWICKTIGSSFSTQSPPSRGGCSWTQVGSRYLLFGGAHASQQHFNDIHCFDAARGKWEKVDVSGTPPSPRSGHSAVACGESLVVYGGMNGQDGVTFNDLFELRPGPAECMEWTALSCADLPPRNSHAAVVEAETMIVVGGASPEGQTDEVFTIDLSNRCDLTCRKVSCNSFKQGTGNSRAVDLGAGVPVAREMHSACAYLSKEMEGADTATILVMGGRSATGVLRDLFSLNTASWTWERLQDAPVARCAHSACFVKTAGIMAIFGGWDGGTTVAGDLHIFGIRCGEWTTPDLSPRPVGRFAHASLVSEETNSLLVFGGVNPEEEVDDVLVLTA